MFVVQSSIIIIYYSRLQSIWNQDIANPNILYTYLSGLITPILFLKGDEPKKEDRVLVERRQS